MHLSKALVFVKESKITEKLLLDQANTGIVSGVNLSTKQNATITPKALANPLHSQSRFLSNCVKKLLSA